jgi:hypothetical protein
VAHTFLPYHILKFGQWCKIIISVVKKNTSGLILERDCLSLYRQLEKSSLFKHQLFLPCDDSTLVVFADGTTSYLIPLPEFSSSILFITELSERSEWIAKCCCRY